jgi:hypothetical protein
VSVVVPSGKEPLVLCLLALLITFVLTRMYTRLARAHQWGSASVAGGVHLHHMAVGIMLILGTGLVTVAFWPEGSGRGLLGILFGVGAGLTLDEFALWLYLRDVYWSPEGRRSIDATLVVLLVAALLVLGNSPFGVTDADTVPRYVAAAVISANVLVAALAVLKGKFAVAVLSVFVFLVGVISALRLAKPTSLWARWFYTPGGRKATRARRRYGEESTLNRVLQRFEDVLGGAPHLPSPVNARARLGDQPSHVDPFAERNQEA